VDFLLLLRVERGAGEHFVTARLIGFALELALRGLRLRALSRLLGEQIGAAVAPAIVADEPHGTD